MRWDAVQDDRPCRIWVPPQRPAQTTTRPPRRLPHDVVLTLSDVSVRDLGTLVPRLMAAHDVRAGDRVTIDLREASCADLAGLELLLMVLWRRVGPHGDVALTGGSPGLRAQLRSLRITAATSRSMVYGSSAAEAAPLAVEPAQAAPAAMVHPLPSSATDVKRQAQAA